MDPERGTVAQREYEERQKRQEKGPVKREEDRGAGSLKVRPYEELKGYRAGLWTLMGGTSDIDGCIR